MSLDLISRRKDPPKLADNHECGVAPIKFASTAMSGSGGSKEVRETRRAFKAATEAERKKAKAARDEAKQEKDQNALRVKILHHQYRRDAALQALQVDAKFASFSPHTDG